MLLISLGYLPSMIIFLSLFSLTLSTLKSNILGSVVLIYNVNLIFQAQRDHMLDINNKRLNMVINYYFSLNGIMG